MSETQHMIELVLSFIIPLVLGGVIVWFLKDWLQARILGASAVINRFRAKADALESDALNDAQKLNDKARAILASLQKTDAALHPVIPPSPAAPVLVPPVPTPPPAAPPAAAP